MTEDGYPEKTELQFIRKYDLEKHAPAILLEYMRERWRWPEYFSIKSTGNGFWVEIHTGGWSGHEEMVEALRANKLFFSLYWKETKAGGHYYFKIPVKTAHESADQASLLKEQHVINLVLTELHHHMSGHISGMKAAEDIVGLVKKGLAAVESETTVHEFLKLVNLDAPERKQNRDATANHKHKRKGVHFVL